MKKKPDLWYLFGIFFTLSLEVVIFVIGGFLLGHYLDRAKGTSPLGRLHFDHSRLCFSYCESYLEREASCKVMELKE